MRARSRGRHAAAGNLSLHARRDARRNPRRACSATQQKFVEDHWDARAPGLPFATPEQALILASIVEKETAHSRRAPPYRGRVRQPPEARHEAAVRSHHHLWNHQGLSARPAHPPERDRARHALQHLCDHGPAGDADLQPGQGRHRGRAQPRPVERPLFRRRRNGRPRLLATISPSTRRTSPNGARSRKGVTEVAFRAPGLRGYSRREISGVPA